MRPPRTAPRNRSLAITSLLLLVASCTQGSPGLSEADPDPSTESREPATDRVLLHLDNVMAGWIPSGMMVSTGDSVALFADGSVELQGLQLLPRHLIWYRVGPDGDAIELIADQQTFTASADGEIFVTLRPAGMLWSDRRGSYPAGYTSAAPVAADIRLELVRLAGDAATALNALAAAGDPNAPAALAAEAARKTLPPGFQHLWFLSYANVWSDGALDGRPGISADTDDDASIVRMPVDAPLTEQTQFVFDWRYDALPALGPETSPQFHDYLSVALEFDNGQDLTWLWSTELPEHTHFACPLPGWENRETHWVLQTGKNGLGQWFTHRRDVLDDYQKSIPGAPPSRIVAVWFIANSLFGRQRAAASFADVAIENGAERREIFPARR